MIAVWAKITAAVSLETAAVSLLGRTDSVVNLAGYFVLHALASTIAALLAWVLLPGNFKKPFAAASALLWSFAFSLTALCPPFEGGRGMFYFYFVVAIGNNLLFHF